MSRSQPMPFAILASGRGSNAAALMDAAAAKPDLFRAVALISDRADAGALEEARKRGVDTFIVPPKDEGPLLSILERLKPEWLCLAGYRRLVSKQLLEKFRERDGAFSRIMNVHPSLLPAFPGLNGYRQAFEAGVKVAGVTVHLVDEGLDTGKVLLQESFERLETDDLERFEARGLRIEHRLFCRALRKAAEQKIQVDAKGRWVRIHE